MEATNAENKPTNGKDYTADKKMKLSTRLLIIDVTLLLILQAATIILFMSGMARVFGKDMTILRCIYIIGDLFDFNSAIAYRLIISTVLDITYIAFLVYMIKSFVSSLKTAKEYKSNAIKTIKNLKDSSATVLIMSFAFIVLSNLFYSNELSGITIAVLCIAGIILTFNEGLIEYYKTNKIIFGNLLSTCLKFLIVYTLIGLLLAKCNQSVVLDFIDGWTRMLNMIVAWNNIFKVLRILFNYIAVPIMYAVLVYLIIKCAHYQLSGFHRNYVKNKITQLLIFIVTILILNFIFNELIASEFKYISVDMLTSWWKSIKNTFLPIFLLILSWRIIQTVVPQEKD